MTGRIGAWAGAAALVFALGLATGWILWRPIPAKPETYAPAIRQPDGSLILERKPQPDAKPAQEVPRGTKVERIVQVTVQPRASVEATPPINGSGPEVVTLPEMPRIPCPPVTVDLTLLRMPDQSRRVVASSPDGDVIGGVDIPVDPAQEQRKLPWAAGALWNPSDRTYGAFLHRDAGPLRLGVEAMQVRQPVGSTRWEARVAVGLRWGR